MDKISIKLYIAEWSEARGMKLTEIAEKTGIAYKNVNMIANHYQWPREDSLVKIARALDIDAEYLFRNPSEVKANTAKYICPHCGKELSISVNICAEVK